MSRNCVRFSSFISSMSNSGCLVSGSSCTPRLWTILGCRRAIRNSHSSRNFSVRNRFASQKQRLEIFSRACEVVYLGFADSAERRRPHTEHLVLVDVDSRMGVAETQPRSSHDPSKCALDRGGVMRTTWMHAARYKLLPPYVSHPRTVV